ncbi:MAG TPA: FixH family protein [Chloroflexia bacterium]|jgi:hypothetical protein
MTRSVQRRARQHTFLLQLAVFAVGTLVVLGLAACGGNGADSASVPTSTAIQLALTTDPDPPAAGPAKIVVEVKDAGGKPVDSARVSISIRHVGMSHGGIEGELTPEGSGRYVAEGSFSMSGTWRAEVQVTPQGGSPTTQSFDIEVGQ